MIFQGNCSAVVTPFQQDGKSINYTAFKKIINKQIEGNCSAILFMGTTGENSTLTQKEGKEIAEFGIQEVRKRVPIIIGAGSNNTEEAVERSQFYQKLGADALLHITPYYNKCTQQGLIEHFSKIADSVDIPIILYNVPARTGVNMLPETVETLSHHKNIAGIKEASGNIQQVAEIIRLCPKDFSVYSGEDALTLSVLALGGKGVISVVGNLLPRTMANLCKEFFKGNIEEAKEIQFAINPLIKSLFIEVNPIPIKTALNISGLQVGPCRLPLTPMSAENKLKLEEQIQALPPSLRQ